MLRLEPFRFSIWYWYLLSLHDHFPSVVLSPPRTFLITALDPFLGLKIAVIIDVITRCNFASLTPVIFDKKIAPIEKLWHQFNRGQIWLLLNRYQSFLIGAIFVLLIFAYLKLSLRYLAYQCGDVDDANTYHTGGLGPTHFLCWLLWKLSVSENEEGAITSFFCAARGDRQTGFLKITSINYTNY